MVTKTTGNNIEKVVVTHKTKIQEGIEKKVVSTTSVIKQAPQQKKEVPTK